MTARYWKYMFVATLGGLVILTLLQAIRPSSPTTSLAAFHVAGTGESPESFLARTDPGIAWVAKKLLSPDKFRRTYKNVLRSRDARGFNGSDHLRLRPEDAVVIHDPRDEGRLEAWVFTDEDPVWN